MTEPTDRRRPRTRGHAALSTRIVMTGASVAAMFTIVTALAVSAPAIGRVNRAAVVATTSPTPAGAAPPPQAPTTGLVPGAVAATPGDATGAPLGAGSSPGAVGAPVVPSSGGPASESVVSSAPVASPIPPLPTPAAAAPAPAPTAAPAPAPTAAPAPPTPSTGPS